jgi:hypothetical protein
MNRDMASATVACVLVAAMSVWFDVVGYPLVAAGMGVLALAATGWLVVEGVHAALPTQPGSTVRSGHDSANRGSTRPVTPSPSITRSAPSRVGSSPGGELIEVT